MFALRAWPRAGRAARLFLVLGVLGAAAAGLYPTALGAQQPPLLVAILGVQDILQESAASDVVRAELQKREAALKAEVEKRENALLASDQQLAQQRGTLSAEEFAQKRNELAQQAAEVRRYAQQEQIRIAEMARGAEARIRQELVQIAAEIAKERGVNLVLNKAQVLLFPTELDITDEALAQLNARLPTVSLEN